MLKYGEREGKGREGKGREGKGREGKGREGKGREGKGREGKGRDQKVLEGDLGMPKKATDKKFQIQNNLAPVLQCFVID